MVVAFVMLFLTLPSQGAVASAVEAEPTMTDAGSDPTPPEGATIEVLYPNPVAEGNVGEYLVVDVPRTGNWTLTDGHHATALPESVSGRVALSTDPDAAAAHVDGRVYELPKHFPLSADGDRIVLRYEGVPVDVVAYERAREATVWNRSWTASDANHADPGDPDDPGWRPYGFTPREAVDLGPATGEVYVLPDQPDAPVTPLEGAERRLYVAAYTFDSHRVSNALIAAEARGADVRLLVEGTPVGGFPSESERHLDRLIEAGVDVRVLDGPKKRFAFHHAKYAVADDTAVVLTENWKPAGTGGAGSRGWGVTVSDGDTADELARLFESDADWRSARPWNEFRANTTTHETGRADGSYPARFERTPFEADRVELLTAPGNAEDRIVGLVDSADERVYAVVPRTGGADQRLVRSMGRAAGRNVDTRLLLSGAWYDRERNVEVAEELATRNDGTVGSVETTVTDGRGRYAKLHAKGLVIDDTVVIGSLNWNDRAAGHNREVLVVLESATAAEFFVRVMAADRRGGGVELPLGFLGGFVLLLAVAGGLASREVAFVNR